MTPETLEALKGSIEKWRKIVEENGPERGPRNCPLCQLFWRHFDDNTVRCDGCPVKERTGMDGCAGTPYDDWLDDGETEEAARAELEFLRSLLPEEEGE